MAVITNINRSDDKADVLYEGKVLNWYELNGYHDSDWYAEVWDEETESIKQVLYMTTRCGCSGKAELDATDEVLRKVYHLKKRNAASAFDYRNEANAKKPQRGDTVRIVKGRKVKKGLVVPVFWAGMAYNPYARYYEERIGVEVDGERIFISAENAEVIGWEDKLIKGKLRKKIIRQEALESMPYAYRHYFERRR